METGQSLYRHDNFFMLLAAEPQKSHAFLDKILQIHLEELRRFLEDVGEFVDIVLFGDDLGTQTGAQISPATYREFFKPRHSEMWRLAKRLAEVKVMLHCCGGFAEFIPDLIEAGLDGLHAVQPSCRGMELRKLKAEFGDKILFNGAIDSHHVLIDGTPQSVRDATCEVLDIMKPGGGYVAGASHDTILEETPLENVLAMFETVREYGVY